MNDPDDFCPGLKVQSKVIAHKTVDLISVLNSTLSCRSLGIEVEEKSIYMTAKNSSI